MIQKLVYDKIVVDVGMGLSHADVAAKYGATAGSVATFL
jgi:hypothetical protein